MKIKSFLLTFILAFILCFTSGCSLSLSSYLDTINHNNSSPEVVLPTNGIDGKDGEDGDSIDLYAIYQQLIELNEYDGTYAEFVREYLGVEDTAYAVNKGINSVVSIVAGFSSTIQYQNGPLLTETFEAKSYSAGTGVIFRLDKSNGDAFIITNYHVVYNNSSSPQISDEIHLFLYGQEYYEINTLDSISIDWKTYYYKELTSEFSIPATYLGGSMQYDLAVLKVSGSNLIKNSPAREATFANSNEISIGDKAIAIGNASSMGLSATEGVISVDSEYISMLGADDQTQCTFRVMRTDAAINGGNSGGGLFNSNGEVIGIVNAKIMSSTIENIGYAIPSAIVVKIAENIIKNCDGVIQTTVKRCVLGISIVATNSYARQTFNSGKYKTEIFETIAINSITSGGASDGKLNVGDIIKTVTVNYSSGESLTFIPTRTFHLVDIGLTLSVGDTVIISSTSSTGMLNQDAIITLTQNDIIEHI